MFEPIVSYVGGLLTAVVIWYLSDKSSRKQREQEFALARADRLADYEAFLLEWEQRIERSSPGDVARAYFTEGAAQFRSRAAKVRRDFPDRAEFNRLEWVLARMNPVELRGQPPEDERTTLANAIRAVIRYVQSA